MQFKSLFLFHHILLRTKICVYNLSGTSKGKKTGKPNRLTRFPSDNSLTKKKRIPPIHQPKEPKSHNNNNQVTQATPDQQPLNNSYPKQGHPMGNGTWVLHVAPSPQQNGYTYRPNGPIMPEEKVFIPAMQAAQPPLQFPPLYQSYSPNSFNPYQHDSPPQVSPVLNHQYNNAPISGPPSGGYHHQPRQRDFNADYQQLPHPPHQPPRNPYQPEPTQPQPPVRQPLVPRQQPQQHYASYSGGLDATTHQHPAYDYSGYMNYSEPALNKPDVMSYEVCRKYIYRSIIPIKL